MLQFRLNANQPIPLSRPAAAAPASARPILALALLLGAIFASAALTRAAPRLVAADLGAKLVALLAACWLAATFEQRIVGGLRGGIGRAMAAMLFALTGLGVAAAGSVAALHIAAALGDRGTLALALLAFGVWLGGAAFGSLLAGSPHAPRRSLRASTAGPLVLVFALSALGGLALARYGPALVARVTSRLPTLFAPLAVFRPATHWLPTPWVVPLLLVLLFALAAALSVTLKHIGTVVEGLSALGNAFDDAANGRMRTRVAPGGVRELARVIDGHQRMLDGFANRRDLERLFAPKSTHALELLQKAVPNARLAPAERVATVVVAELRDVAPNLRAQTGHQMVGLFGYLYERMADCVDRHGGWLERVSSESLLVLFNAPFDQDDHVIRGTRCAIEMQTELAKFNREDAVRPLGSFNLAIGVATGPVFIGTTAELENPRFVLVGDTIEIASRLAAVTPSGQVWVNQHNAETLPMYIPSVMLAAISLRGRPQAVAPYRVWPPP
jgi:class 3 adenylate cyclase